MTQQQQQQTGIAGDLVCGSLAGICGKLVEHPADTVKIRLQTQATLLPTKTGESSVGKQPVLFRGAWHCFRETLRREGLVGLYRGLPSPLLGAMLENATLFMVYNASQSLIRSIMMQRRGASLASSASNDDDDSPLELSPAQLLLAGSMASAAAAVVLTPVELVKCRAQVATVQFGLYTDNNHKGGQQPSKHVPKVSAWRVLMKVLREDGGPRTLYRGFSWTAVREIGGGTMWFGTYELMCHLQLQRKFPNHTGYGNSDTTTSTTTQSGERRRRLDKSLLEPWQLMLSGAAAGVAYNGSFYPADVLKSISQTQPQKMPVMQLVRMVWRQGGLRAFYRGCTITVARSVPSNALVFYAYETLSRQWRTVFHS